MEGTYYWLALGFIALAAGLIFVAPEARRRVFISLVMFLLAYAGLVVAGAMLTWGGGPDGITYRWIRNLSVLVTGLACVNLVGALLFKVVLKSLRLEPPPIVRDLILAVAYIVVTLSMLSRLGVNLTGIVATSAVVTAVIGFSLQDTLGNIMGGMALQMERSISVGDWIRVGEWEGQVKEIRWRQTSIETRQWDTVIVPNSQLMKSAVVVLGRRQGKPRQRVVPCFFNVDYRHSPTEVIDAVDTAIQAEPIVGVAADPPPTCVILEYKDSFATYSLRYYLTDLSRPEAISSQVRSRIFSALRRAGINPSIPAQAVFVTEDGDTRRQRKQSEEMERRLEALRGVELFDSLTEEEKAAVASRLSLSPFVRGEAMTRQGAQAHNFYLITRGSAEVRVAADGTSVSQKVATLGPGDFFGEMSLMTGDPRSATVIALTDVNAYRLDKEAFNDILQRRPEIATDISHILAQRRAELEAIREGLNEEAKRQRARRAEGDLLRRIRDFFRLDGH